MAILPLREHSLIFAPMEGITDEFFRNTIHALYPQWDAYSCDFLKVPSTNPYPVKHIKKHLGLQVLQDQMQRNKTIYQVLASRNGIIKETAQSISLINHKWIDLNLGCPSKTVYKNQGGSYLLDHLPKLQAIVKEIRANFPHVFTCKIRVGVNDDHNFERIIKTLEAEGVDAITIHARTKKELYTGIANWDYIKKAVTWADIPIIANGDIWNTDDIERCFDYTGCHSQMFGRPALKTPWLARQFRTGEKECPEIRIAEMIKYFCAFYKETEKQPLVEASRIKRLKSVSRYIFDELPAGDHYKKRFLLSKTFTEQIDVLSQLRENHLN